MPVFLLALAAAPDRNYIHTALAFIILHLFVYPASNGYNSYFDKDEGSIGGLKNPPKTTKELYNTSLIFDLIGIVLAFIISSEFAIMILIYGLISKAYSHPLIRLKKYPIWGWVAAGVFQGYFTFLMSYGAITETSLAGCFTLDIQLPGLLSTVLLLGSYPMTQIYQHEEDAARGDITISQKLGILGTFHFTSISFLFATLGFFYYFSTIFSVQKSILFGVFMSPVLIYFGLWYMRVRKNRNQANFESTMRLNFISSLMLNSYFIYLWVS